jgi:hypothetical protein
MRENTTVSFSFISVLIFVVVGTIIGSSSVGLSQVSAKTPKKLYVVKKGDLWGYIDVAGNIAIPPKYQGAYEFAEGLALVVTKEKDPPCYRRSFIDNTGKVVILTSFCASFAFISPIGQVEPEGVSSFRDGVALIRGSEPTSLEVTDGKTVTRFAGKLTYIDRSGKTILQPAVDNAWSFSEGLAAIQMNKKFGFMDKGGRITVKTVYDSVLLTFSQGLAGVKLQGKWGFIDRLGNSVIAPRFNDCGAFSETLAAVEMQGKWGYIYRTGKMAIETKFQEAQRFSEGLAAVKMGGKWGYIDKTGMMVIDTEFQEALSFSAGLAAVQMGTKWGYIDKTGKQLTKVQFEDAWSFSGSIARVQVLDRIGYINKMGVYVWNPTN